MINQHVRKAPLKVLSSKMDPAEIRFIKERDAEGFQKTPPVPHPPRALQTIKVTPCFLIAN